ncbi:heterokaryon incompatibility protein-domain-containing protein [Lasiosphaeris hirsuta]|uniref:Heterokaryon incompatibility protein-domain-containing protein n=1 Tax=Lasiosphaeris hirsuta TaxID=260670 RepID=A0AA40DQ55_9PEZI|nr:heterokaryon incompatibility protein-domain-containing protein [Lasiosphaeris hirsuta]
MDAASHLLPLSLPDRPPTPATAFTGLLCSGRLVNPSQVDYGLVQQWLGTCDAKHMGPFHLQSLSQRTRITPHCIDCQTHEIVQIPSHQYYVALSYVWGPQHGASVSAKGEEYKLPQAGVPGVIQDAMAVVLELDKRYLWVDKYCISKDEESTKRLQIHSMHHIHEGAYVIITACAGSDASYSFPGTRRSREQQPSVKTSRVTFVSSLPNLWTALRDSTWITRGWTYQECVFVPPCAFLHRIPSLLRLPRRRASAVRPL